jgi:uncharacterized protein
MKKRSALLVCLVLVYSGTGLLRAQGNIAGDWQGAINLSGISLGIHVHFKGVNDSLTATIDIPMQMAKGLPLTNVRAIPPAVHFELAAGPGLAVFEGMLRGDSISGDFRQGAAAAKFSLHREAIQKEGTTIVSLPYREEEVKIVNGDITLAGTLSLPERGGPFPAAILITGSGAQNRDEEIFGFAPFKILADHLTRNGIAVLRCDDRGIGGSTGSMTTATTVDFAVDVTAMMRFLQARGDIKGSQIGLIGHSEGAVVASMVAAGSRDPAFVVFLSGPAMRGDSVILEQIRVMGRMQGEDEEAIQRGLALERRVFATVRAQKGWDALRMDLLAEMRHSMDRLPADQKAALSDSVLAGRLDLQMKAIQTPWFGFFISHDPTENLSGIRCPVLAMFGDLDKQVPPALNAEPMKRGLQKNGNPDVTVSIVPGVNHLYQKAVTGSPMEYAGLEKKFADGVLEQLSAWLTKRITP